MTALVAATSIVVASAGAAGAAPSSTPYTCAGGDIPSGTYASITVTGFCDVVPDAVINVVGNLVGNYMDLVELMALAARGKVKLHTQEYTLKDINQAIDDLYGGRLNGRGILVP